MYPNAYWVVQLPQLLYLLKQGIREGPSALYTYSRTRIILSPFLFFFT